MTSVTFEDTEKRIRSLLVNDFKLDSGKLTLDARLDELGVDSIGMAELIFSIEDELGLKLTDAAVQLSTFGEVVQFIDEALANRHATTPPPQKAHAVPTAT
jgi:acyl carrier protein